MRPDPLLGGEPVVGVVPERVVDALGVEAAADVLEDDEVARVGERAGAVDETSGRPLSYGVRARIVGNGPSPSGTKRSAERRTPSGIGTGTLDRIRTPVPDRTAPSNTRGLYGPTGAPIRPAPEPIAFNA